MVYLILLYQPTGLMPGDDCPLGGDGGWGGSLREKADCPSALDFDSGLKTVSRMPLRIRIFLTDVK